MKRVDDSESLEDIWKLLDIYEDKPSDWEAALGKVLLSLRLRIGERPKKSLLDRAILKFNQEYGSFDTCLQRPLLVALELVMDELMVVPDTPTFAEIADIFGSSNFRSMDKFDHHDFCKIIVMYEKLGRAGACDRALIKQLSP